MRTTRIFTESDLIVGESVLLDERASHHLGKVLRAKVGEHLLVFNGHGGQFTARIEAIGKKQVTVCIGEESQPNTESPLHTHLGIGISKGDRFDWALQKSTEMGVTVITPLLTERCEVRLKSDRLEKKIQHWKQILISACEQCGRNQVPKLNQPTEMQDWIAERPETKKLVLHHRSSHSLTESEHPDSVAMLIGPEGGLSELEIESAEQHGFAPLTLGPRILRTETAPVAVLAALQCLWGDW